jgi:hypothetical protein
MVALRKPCSQSEETRSRPATAGDRARDFGKRTVTLPVEADTVVEDRDSVRGPLPLANQDGARLGHAGLRSIRCTTRGFFNHAGEQPAGGGFDPAICSLLEAVGDSASQKDRPISREGGFPLRAFQRSRSSSVSSCARLAISAASASRSLGEPGRFICVSPGILEHYARPRGPCPVLLGAEILPLQDTHIALVASESQSG